MIGIPTSARCEKVMPIRPALNGEICKLALFQLVRVDQGRQAAAVPGWLTQAFSAREQNIC
jgi:hypothetical protein